ncbi:MAG: CDP-alcohol phosphatidyltransferase family protein [Desulfobacteraceae bacterium]|jgi:cardiolipin synthase
MTIPNIITMIRILLTPIFVIYLINDQLLTGLVILVICGVSDGLDGFIARVFKQKSKLGSYLDPLADKIILMSAFIALSIRGFLPSWLSVTVISRDVLILIGVIILYLTGVDLNIKPVISSKITTCFQFTTVIAVLAREYLIPYQDYYIYLYYVTALFTIISFLQYLYQWQKMMADKPDRE